MMQAMMSSARASLGGLHALQARQLEALHALALAPLRAVVPSHPLTMAGDHLAAWQGFAQQALGRQMLAWHALLGLAAEPQRAGEGFAEAIEMQRAILARLQQQWQGWQDGLAVVGKTAAGIRRADTMSKLFEQEYDVFAQLGALISKQASQWLGLVEGAQVGYGYLLADKAGLIEAGAD